MKTFFLTFLFLWSASLLYTQENDLQTGNDSTSYFGEECCWSYKAHLYDLNVEFRWTPAQFHLQRDTVINHKHYKQYQTCESYPFTAIRQENQKIYAVDNSHSGEYLLYDFGMNVGDVISSEAQSGYLSRNPIVTQVDSIWLYNGERRKRMVVNGDVWIEGIGSTHGFDYPVREFVTCDCNNEYQLIAFAKENTVSFFDSELAPEWGYCGNVVDVFPRSDAIWNIIALLNPPQYYGIKGDTLIEGKLYQKLFWLDAPDLNIDEKDRYFGAFLQENKKVWFRTKFQDGNNEQDFLLYDFSKNIGDTIHHGYFRIEYGYLFIPSEHEWITIIKDISEVQGRKVFSIHSGYYTVFDFGGVYEEMSEAQWIEGVGGDYGLFFSIFPIPTCECPQERQILACLKENDAVKYLNEEYCSDCFSCSIPSGMEEKKITDRKLYLLQNGTGTLALKSELDLIVSVEIFDISGKKLYRKDWENPEKEKMLM
jgi:hypothetical protein